MRLLVTCLFAVALVGCGSVGPTSQPVVAGPRSPGVAPAVDSGATVLGIIDGAAVRRDDLEKSLQSRIDDLDNEAEQRRLHLLWVGLEDVLAERILTKEARRRGMSIEALREKEILSKTTPPSDEEVRQFYDQNADRIGVELSIVAAQIKTELVAEKARANERAFVDRLRGQSTIKYSLPVPQLPRVRVEAGKGPSWGKPDAKVTIVEFSDFQCPFCARASNVLHQLMSLYPNDVRIEFRDFPLAQHSEARAAAEAARCADEQGKFWEYHDLLFVNARALGPDDLKQYASDVKLDLSAFSSCLASNRAKEAVDAAMALGKKTGVEGTPALYVNGIKLVGLLPLPIMQAIIDRELGQK